MGTFSQKISSQLPICSTAPPTSGPSAMPSPAIALSPAMASPRRASETAPTSSVSDSGRSTAAPSPCSARAVTSAPTEVASAAPADAAVNRPIPARNVCLRPNRSPTAAAVSRKTANARV